MEITQKKSAHFGGDGYIRGAPQNIPKLPDVKGFF